MGVCSNKKACHSERSLRSEESLTYTPCRASLLQLHLACFNAEGAKNAEVRRGFVMCVCSHSVNHSALLFAALCALCVKVQIPPPTALLRLRMTFFGIDLSSSQRPL